MLFGGAAAGQNRGTTWEWNGTAWVTRDVPGPAQRSAHGLVYDERRGKVVLFGGSGPGRLGDTWEWDGERWTRFEEPGPPARVAPGLAYDSKRGRTLLFGGGGADGALGDTWVFDGTTWEQLDIAGPPPRLSPGLAYSSGTSSCSSEAESRSRPTRSHALRPRAREFRDAPLPAPTHGTCAGSSCPRRLK